jgi:hypothetical protein
MRRVILAMLFVSSATGCATMNHKVKYEQLDASPTSYVVDETKPDGYPGFLAAEGNIYSCRYGIHHQSQEEFEPPKVEVFAKLMAKYDPKVTSRRVVLQRFDVYYNHRLKAVASGTAAAGGAVGGAVGASIQSSGQDAAAVNRNVFTFKKIVIDPDPLKKQDPTEHWVGCDDEHEGEYSAKTITGGSDVVVTWLQFTLDGKPYQFRSFYQFQPEKNGDVEAAIAAAVALTIEGISPRVIAQR